MRHEVPNPEHVSVMAAMLYSQTMPGTPEIRCQDAVMLALGIYVAAVKKTEALRAEERERELRQA